MSTTTKNARNVIDRESLDALDGHDSVQAAVMAGTITLDARRFDVMKRQIAKAAPVSESDAERATVAFYDESAHAWSTWAGETINRVAAIKTQHALLAGRAEASVLRADEIEAALRVATNIVLDREAHKDHTNPGVAVLVASADLFIAEAASILATAESLAEMTSNLDGVTSGFDHLVAPGSPRFVSMMALITSHLDASEGRPGTFADQRDFMRGKSATFIGHLLGY